MFSGTTGAMGFWFKGLFFISISFWKVYLFGLVMCVAMEGLATFPQVFLSCSSNSLRWSAVCCKEKKCFTQKSHILLQTKTFSPEVSNNNGWQQRNQHENRLKIIIIYPLSSLQLWRLQAAMCSQILNIIPSPNAVLHCFRIIASEKWQKFSLFQPDTR